MDNNIIYKKFGECCIRKGTYGINAPAVEFKENLPRYIRITDIDELGRYTDLNAASVHNDDADNFLLSEGDIVFARTGNTTGKSYIYRKLDGKLVYAGFLIKFTPNPKILDVWFLKHYLETEQYTKWITIMSQRSGQPGINAEEYYNMIVPIFPILEQQKIVEILSTWDSAIEKQEELIEKKKEFKKGLMQRFLSGGVRFKEFKDKWKVVKVKEIANSLSELNKADEELTVLSCTKYDGLVESLKYFGKRMFSDDTSKYKKVWKNDFAYATNHIEEGSIGVQRVCNVGLVSPMYTVFRVDTALVDIDYLFYLLKTDKYISIYKSMTSASVDRRGSLRWTEFSKIKLYLPSLEEQKKISEILKSMDKEIVLLQKELEAIKLQKKGLMQRLLTGEVRVKV